MNSLIPLDFNSHAVRAVLVDGSPWFVANDVCSALGYVNSRDAIKKHCRSKGVAKRDTPTNGGSQALTCIDEGNLYRLAIKSKKPEARKFEDWVCDDVLPTIRKTGKYEAPRKSLTPEQQRHIQELVNRIQHQQGTHWNTTYHNIKTRFQVGSYKDVRAEDYPSLCHFLGGTPLEGEWMPKQSNSAKPYSFPASLIRPSNAVGNTGWLTLDELNKSERPLGDLLNQLEADGHDVGGAKLEYLGMQKLLASSRRQLDAISGLINDARHYGLNVTLGDGSVNTSGYIDHQGRG